MSSLCRKAPLIFIIGYVRMLAFLILLFSLVGFSKERAVGFAATILLMSVAAKTIGFLPG